MKLSFAILACVATSVVAGPLVVSRSTFTDPTCKLSKAVTPGTPFSVLFPLANLLGSIVGPTVKAAIGAENEEKLDKLADNLCINSQQEPVGERGICAELLQVVRDFANEKTPAGQVHQYNCLLNLLCVARAGTLDGTCQYLLAGADCVANRILQTEDLECENK
ncbi:hypothetical protein Q7P36_000265 [Cladosporium allicinum]